MEINTLLLTEGDHLGPGRTTSRAKFTVRRPPNPEENFADFSSPASRQSVINELIIGTGYKITLSIVTAGERCEFRPAFDLDPTMARIFNAIYGINIPPPLAPICFRWSPMPRRLPLPAHRQDRWPTLLRLNTGVAPTTEANRSRLGLIAGDAQLPQRASFDRRRGLTLQPA